MSWNRWGQSDPTYSQARADSAIAQAKAARARDLKAAKERKKAEKAAKKESKNK